MVEMIPQANYSLPIGQGSAQNPYKEFTYTIQPFAAETIFYVFDYFRLISFTGTIADMRLRFGGSGSDTQFTGAGIGYKLIQPLDRVTIRNEGAAPMTVTVAMAVGFISDDRLNFQNTGTPLPTDPIPASTIAQSQVAVANVAVAISNQNSLKRRITILAGLTDLYIGALGVTTGNGFKIPANGGITIETSAAVYGIRTGASDVCYTLGEFI